jgi:hypothetical protein
MLLELIDKLYEGKAGYHEQKLAAEIIEGQSLILRGILNDRNRSSSVQNQPTYSDLQVKSVGSESPPVPRFQKGPSERTLEDASPAPSRPHDCATDPDNCPF